MKNKGFTLIELTVVLFIVSLLLGGLLAPLSAQIEARRVSDTNKSLHEIKEHLLGFAITNNARLPCPATETDPLNVNYGLENCSVADGFLPWRDLGLNDWLDKWEQQWRYRVDVNYLAVFSMNTYTADELTILDEAGNPMTTIDPVAGIYEYPVAIIYSTGMNKTPDGENAMPDNIFQYGNQSTNYDDILTWLSRAQLFMQLVRAGTLP